MTAILHGERALSAAVSASRVLVRWMEEPDLGTLEQVEPTFETLAAAIEALPPTEVDVAMLCYFRNQVSSSRQLFDVGEWGAAGYQLRQVYIKLHRIVTEAA